MAGLVPGEAKGFIAPFLFDDIEGLPDWRDRLAWPVSLIELRRSAERACEVSIAFAASLADDFERQVAVAAAGRFVNGMMALVEAALVAQSEASQGIRILGGPPELAYLRGQTTSPVALADRHRGKGVADLKRNSWPALRAIARTHSWSGLSGLMPALLFPEAIAISHNSLLIASARRLKPRLRYWPASNLLHRARNSGAPAPDGAEGLAARVLPALLACFPQLEEPFRTRLGQAFLMRLGPILRQAAIDVAGLRQLGRLPKAVWRGTGGSYAARLIGEEVLRRGGRVRGFDHGGDTGMSQLLGLTALIELMAASEFCVSTPEVARLLEASGATRLTAPLIDCRLVAGEGQSLFRKACLDTKPTGSKRRVVYVGHPFRGLRQFAIVGTPDVVYWDLQSRVAATIAKMPVDLICKPHPEGAFAGRRNPIEDIAPTSYRRFEEHLADTDVFVFDAPTSTTFAEALCTNRPVVLIDRGHYPFNPQIEARIAERVRLVPSRTDERGRIWPDEIALEDAICGGSAFAEPSYFRRLLAGAV